VCVYARVKLRQKVTTLLVSIRVNLLSWYPFKYRRILCSKV